MHQTGQPPGPGGSRRRGIPAMAERSAAWGAEPAAVRRRRAAEDRARRAQRRTEDRERQKQRKAEDVEQRQARRAEDTEVASVRRAADLELRQERRAESDLLKQHRRDEKLYRRELRAAEKLARREERTLRRVEREEERQEQRARHAAAVAERREAEAAARDLLKQAKDEARRVHKQRKAEDAELRKRRKAEDAERRKAVATDARVQVHKKRRWSLWLGLGLLAAGLSLAGYIGWQLWGTNWLSHRTHERIVDDVREEWEVASSTTLSRSVVPTVDVPEGDVSGLIRIPEFGGDYVVPVLEGTSDKVLAAGFGHFEDSADPGDVGNYALAAHRVTHGEPLRDMPELEAGDEVIVETQYATYTYELTTDGDDLRVTFRDYWVVDSLPTNPDPDGVQPAQLPGQRLLTLTTCAELFHTDDRLIAFGVLTDTDLKS